MHRSFPYPTFHSTCRFSSISSSSILSSLLIVCCGVWWIDEFDNLVLFVCGLVTVYSCLQKHKCKEWIWVREKLWRSKVKRVQIQSGRFQFPTLYPVFFWIELSWIAQSAMTGQDMIYAASWCEKVVVANLFLLQIFVCDDDGMATKDGQAG